MEGFRGEGGGERESVETKSSKAETAEKKNNNRRRKESSQKLRDSNARVLGTLERIPLDALTQVEDDTERACWRAMMRREIERRRESRKASFFFFFFFLSLFLFSFSVVATTHFF